MENAKTILQEICGTLDTHYETVKSAFEAYDVFVRALEKYNTNVLEIIFDKRELEYEKIVWQILMDLRRAKDIDLDCDEYAAKWDSHYLYTISKIVEKYDKNVGLIEVSALDYKTYEKICREKGLIY